VQNESSFPVTISFAKIAGSSELHDERETRCALHRSSPLDI
jgi:hypothetical protein